MHSKQILSALAIVILTSMAWADGPDHLHVGPKPGIEETIPTIMPDFSFIDQDNKEGELRDYRGKIVLINFIYTSCKDICPFVTQRFARVKDGLGNHFYRDAILLSITMDPFNDSPAMLKAYARKWKADVPGWRFLTGNINFDLDGFLDFVGLSYRRDGEHVIHDTLTIIVDREGRLHKRYWGYYDPQWVIEEVKKLVGRERKHAAFQGFLYPQASQR